MKKLILIALYMLLPFSHILRAQEASPEFSFVCKGKFENWKYNPNDQDDYEFMTVTLKFESPWEATRKNYIYFSKVDYVLEALTGSSENPYADSPAKIHLTGSDDISIYYRQERKEIIIFTTTQEMKDEYLRNDFAKVGDAELFRSLKINLKKGKFKGELKDIYKIPFLKSFNLRPPREIRAEESMTCQVW